MNIFFKFVNSNDWRNSGKVIHELRVTYSGNMSYEFISTSLKARVKKLKVQAAKLKARLKKLKVQVEARKPRVN